MNEQGKNIFQKLTKGEVVPLTDAVFVEINRIVDETMVLSQQLNNATSKAEVRRILGDITGTPVDESTTLFIPFHTNLGRFIKLGKGVFINHGCSFLDMGGITIEDEVQIGPRVSLVTENHPLEPSQRKSLVCQPVTIKRNAWIGAGAVILPGVTIGVNAVVAAGAVVSKDVPDNTVVAGIPAKVIKHI